MNLNFTKERITEERVRSSMAAMVDIDTFLSALDDIEALQDRLKRTEENVLALRGELENVRKMWGESIERRLG